MPENIEAAGMKSKIEALTKELDACKHDPAIQQRENVYLNKINDLPEKRK